MQILDATKGVGVGLFAGFVGTKVMEPVAMGLYKLEPTSSREREDRVRPGSPYEIAAKKTFGLLGVDLEGKQLDVVSKLGFHYGLGMAWAPLYLALRRWSGMTPVGAGIVTGASLSLIVDEAIGPALGFTAKSQEYPVVTHARGFVAHLVYGLAVAGAVELVFKLIGARESLNPSSARRKLE